MSTQYCAVTGNIQDLLGNNISGVTLSVYAPVPFFHDNGTLISGQLSQTQTDTSGNFSVSVIETATCGQSITFQFEYYDGVSGRRKKTWSAVVPNQSTATLASLIASTPGSAVTPLGVPYGGTGVSTLTQYAVLIGEGASAVQFASPGTSGLPLVSNGASSNPSFQATVSGLTLGGVSSFDNLQSSSTAPATAGKIRLSATDTIRWRDAGNTSDLALSKDSSDRLAWGGSGFIGSYTSSTSTPSTTGTLRLAKTDSIKWRDDANSSDLALSKDSSDRLSWPGGFIGAYTSSTTTPATSGTLRLAKTDSISWRDNANSANLALSKDTSDRLTWGGSGFLGSYTSSTTNPSTSGTLRLATTDTVSWRNNANGANIALSKNTSDSLLYNGNTLITSAGAVSVTSATGTLAPANGGTGQANATSLSWGPNFIHFDTSAGETNISLPFEGTLATLSGTETLTQKIYCSVTTGDPSNVSYGLASGSVGDGNPPSGSGMYDVGGGVVGIASGGTGVAFVDPTGLTISGAVSVSGSVTATSSMYAGGFGATGDITTSTSVTAPYYATSTTSVADTGSFRLASTDTIKWRDQANATNLALSKDSSDRLSWPNGYIGFYVSSTSNAASAGTIRLANTDTIKWRNNANGADVTLAKNTSDQLTYAGTAVFSSSGVLLAAAAPAFTGGDVTSSAGSLNLAIGSAKVTNTMLAGSIAASKLVGSDIATVGTITSGVWNAGAVTSSGTITSNGTTDSGAASTGSLQTAGGLYVTKSASVANMLGVGTTVTNTSSTYSAALAIVTATSTPVLSIAGYGSSQLFNQVIGYGARGTEASPTTVQADDQILWLAAKGYVTGTGFISGSKGVVAIAAEAIWTASSTPTYISFYTTPTSSVTRTEAYRINSAGQLVNKISGSEFTGNNQSVTFTGSKGPAGVTLATTANPTKWLKILDSAGAAAYIPLYQ